MVTQTFKSFIQRSAHRFGYRIDKVVERVISPIDVFDLLVTRLADERGGDFFFIQVGANDGITDDPIRQYITRYHWRGILLEPLPDEYQKLIANYSSESQLIFENAAVADQDGIVQFFVADDPSDKNLTVFSSLRRDAVERALNWRHMNQAAQSVRPIDVRARSVRSLIDQHHVTRVDLLQSDVQGYDCELIRQFLDCGLRPQIIHFEHIHVQQEALQECYQRLVSAGYQFSESANDTVAILKPQNGAVH